MCLLSVLVMGHSALTEGICGWNSTGHRVLICVELTQGQVQRLTSAFHLEFSYLGSAPAIFMASSAWAGLGRGVGFCNRLSSLQLHTIVVLSLGDSGWFCLLERPSRGYFTLIFPAEMSICLGQRAAKQKQQRHMQPCDSFDYCLNGTSCGQRQSPQN